MQLLESIRANKKGIILMLLSSLLASVGQLFWKMSVENGMLLLLVGFMLYGLGAIVMILAYRFGKLSVLQPIVSSSYVWSVALANIVLKENISVMKIIGVLLIISGVVFVAGGDNA